jgi:hypothetical protein
MTEEFLNRADVITGFQQVGSKPMPKRRCGRNPGKFCRSYGLFNRTLQGLFIPVVTPDDGGSRIGDRGSVDS